MSGGAFDYNQYIIRDIADKIERIIEKNGREKTKEEIKNESWRSDDWYEKYPEDRYHYQYPDEVIEKLKEGLKFLRMAEVYANRIDWLISGDDGEENFLSRLKKDLEKLEE